MSVVISGVEPDSIAWRHGFAAGDTLARINSHDIDDVLDYRFHMTGASIVLEGVNAAGAPYRRTIRKGEYDDLGLEFDTYLMDKQRSCKNGCVFCFVDQLPKGLRDTLYFKDDDDRMSFLFGNYITLTNLREKDVQRILAMHISPINISVHTMNPALRVQMMRNQNAGQVLEYIPRLAAGGIKLNTQLVLCPGLNDGPELTRSLTELCALAPGMQSVAVVPVGLTKHREGLAELRLHTREEATAIVETVERFGEEMLRAHGQRICYAADELYLRAERPILPADFYEEFAQLENGVGLMAMLADEFASALRMEPEAAVNRRVTGATGVSAAPLLAELTEVAAEKFPGLAAEVIPI